MKLVLDTNVVMELLHYRDPRSAALMHAITEGRVTCFTDTRCLAELQRVIAEEAELFGQRLRSPEAMEAFQAFFQKRAPDFSKFD